MGEPVTKRLSGKVIVVSGGTKGVGRAAAIAFAQEGASVVIGGRDEAAAQDVIKMINEYSSEGLFIYTDLYSAADCKKLIRMAQEQYGRIDGFFNYAGITPISPLDTCDEGTFDNVMDVNLRAAFFCCQECVHWMRQNGGGSIVLTGSAHAWSGQKDRAAYACSKGALLTLSEHIAHNYAVEHIRCNYLVLGWTPTEGEICLRKQQGESEESLRTRAGKILPMGRMCEVEDYLGMLVSLMSDESTMVTGSVLRITAGEYI